MDPCCVAVAEAPEAPPAPGVDLARGREDRGVLAAAADARDGEAEEALDQGRRRLAALRVVVDGPHGVDDASGVAQGDEGGGEAPVAAVVLAEEAILLSKLGSDSARKKSIWI